MTSLPDLPSSLLELDCWANQLTSLPDLPSSLLELDCWDNQLTSLPDLPNSLVTLRCWENQLTNLPDLPSSLEVLYCRDNQLTSLPRLPSSLRSLGCERNQLTGLPDLPSSLLELDCGGNQLTSLPALPNSLERLLCGDNQLHCLPLLPEDLDILKCTGNTLTCLPNIPLLLPPFGTGRFDSDLGFSPLLCSSNTCFPPEVITGKVFNDANGNGQLDVSEEPFFNGVAEAQPGNYLSGVDASGSYVLPVDTGTYTVQGQTVPYYNITTPVHTVTITPDHIDSLNHIGYQAIPNIYDLVVNISAQVTRPGFDNNVHLQVKNMGTEATTAAIDLDFDTDQTWVSSTVAPASQVGTSANWSVMMAPGDTWYTTVTLNTPPSVALLGTPVEHQLTALPDMPDTTAGNNSDMWNDVVVGSYDPNDKRASPSAMTPSQLLNKEAIEYTIRFQNTGTFLAEHVRITDTLSSDLEWESFEYLSASHENQWNMSNGVLAFQFDNIQLPDSNANEPDSHGFVKFRIKPSQNLVLGDDVVNIANIFFDFNPPVITDPSTFMIDVSSGVNERTANELFIYPNPTTGVLSVQSNAPMEFIELMQLDGRIVRSEGVSATTSQLDLSGLRSGVYLLRVKDERGIRTSRVVLER